MLDFEGEIKTLIKECVQISHYHNGVDYDNAFELTYFEKQILTKFITDEMERQNNIQMSLMKAMGYRTR